jgi:hypothetical protein
MIQSAKFRLDHLQLVTDHIFVINQHRWHHSVVRIYRWSFLGSSTQAKCCDTSGIGRVGSFQCIAGRADSRSATASKLRGICAAWIFDAPLTPRKRINILGYADE